MIANARLYTTVTLASQLGLEVHDESKAPAPWVPGGKEKHKQGHMSGWVVGGRSPMGSRFTLILIGGTASTKAKTG